MFFLLGCGVENGHGGPLSPDQRFGVDDFGVPSEVVVDPLGHQWNLVGRLSDRPEILGSNGIGPEVLGTGVSSAGLLESSGHGASFGEPSAGPGIRTDFVIVTDGIADDWLTCELIAFNDEAIHALDAEYIEMYQFIEDFPEIPDEFSDPRGRIVGTDDRIMLSTDQVTVGGNDDHFVAIRRMNMTLDAGGVGRCTGTMISPTIGITAAHCFAASSNGDTNVSAIQVCDGRGQLCQNSSLIYINGVYRSGQYKRNDWALFALPNAVNFGTANLWTLDVSENEGSGTTVSQVGTPFPAARPMAHSGCSITSAQNKTLTYNCDTISGHSGGPVYRIFGSGATRFRMLVAVHAGVHGSRNRGAKVAEWRSSMVSAMGTLGFGAGETVP